MYKVVVGLTLALSWSASAAAQTITLGRALELAATQHPMLRAGEAGVDAASAGVVTARAYPNPEFGVIAGRQRGNDPRAGVPLYEVRQPLELGSLRGTRVEFAERGREASEHRLDEVRLGVLSQVRRSFYQVLRREAEARQATENLQLVEDLRRRIQVRVDVGEVGRLELVRAEAEVAAARTLASSAQLQQVTAVAQFRAAVGGGLDTAVHVVGSLDPPAALPALEALRQEARQRHPALQRAGAEVRQAEARMDYERALRLPQPTIWTEFDYSSPTYRAGVVVPVPVWNRRQGPIAEADAVLRQVGAEARAREIEILAALDGAYERYMVATQQVALFEQGLLREAEEALRAAEVAYQLGERGILDVLDAQRVLRAVRLNFLNAHYERQAALIDLDELRGHDLLGVTP